MNQHLTQGLLCIFVISAAYASQLNHHGLKDEASGRANYGSSGTATSPTTTGSSAGTGSQSANNGCFPNVNNSTVPLDQLKKVGTWYVYRGKSDQAYNAMYTVSLVGNGLIYVPGTLTAGIHSTLQYQYQNAAGNSFPCKYQYVDIVSRPDGVDFFLTFASNTPNGPLNQVLYYLYNDASPNGFEITYICITPNFQTGICDSIQLYVNTRMNPGQMSASQKNAIDTVIDTTLKPYCMSHSDLQQTIFRTDVQQCNAAPTQQFNSLVQAFASSLPARTA